MRKLTLTAGLCLIIASLGLPGQARILPAYQRPGNPCYGGQNGPYPNPADPHTFFNCDWGNVYLQKCPTNLVYNHAKKACDYPVHPYYTQHPTTTPTTTTSPPTTTPMTTTSPPTTTPITTTSPPTTTIATTTTSSTSHKNPCYGGQNGPYPNPADPHTFFNCDWGNVYLQNCPANLVYNHAKKACDYPVHPYYTQHPTTTPTTTTSPPTTTPMTTTSPPTTTPITTTSPPTTTIATTTTTSSTSHKNPCYGGQNGPYPNPADPHTFFNCDWGNVYLQKCPANLVYNHAKKACDYPIHPYYTQHPTTTPTTTTSPPTTTSMTTTSPPTTTIATTTTSSTSHKNPCYGGQNGPYPNPADPHTFFNCDWGNVYLQKCPANLVYNHAKKACDYPVNHYY
ncbi:uncharacterized protein LOC144386404 [Gasterosteus aculeatus]